MAIVEVSNAVIYPRTVVVWSLCQKFRNGGKTIRSYAPIRRTHLVVKQLTLLDNA